MTAGLLYFLMLSLYLLILDQDNTASWSSFVIKITSALVVQCWSKFFHLLDFVFCWSSGTPKLKQVV
jgi:hypothetical protein